MSAYSIIISAFNSDQYIQECLDSIQHQTAWKKHNIQYEILVGIDGCIRTLDKMSQIQNRYPELSVYHSKENNGTYVTSNALLANVQYDNIIRFDSDDIMMPHLVSYIHENKNEHHYMRMRFKRFQNANRKNMNSPTSDFGALGAIYISRKVVNTLGGYKNWKCAGDLDFSCRWKRSGEGLQPYTKEALFWYRCHSNQLTRKRETNLRSSLRTNFVTEAKSGKGPIKITPKVGVYKKIS